MDRYKKLKKKKPHTLKDLEITIDLENEKERDRDAVDDLDEVSRSLPGLRALANLFDL